MENSSSDNLSKADEDVEPPRATFDQITFSDGTSIDIDEHDIVVFVGPNNAGKSAALKELQSFVGGHRENKTIKSASIKKIGGADQLLSYLKIKSQISGEINNRHYGGIGYNIQQNFLNHYENDGFAAQFAPFFVKRLSTEERIQGSNPAPGIALHQSPPTHPIHCLLMDDELSASISLKFRHAFGMDLTPFRAGGNSYPLYVGKKPAVPNGKDELCKEFVTALQQTNVPLERQGDGMRSFASVLTHTLCAGPQSILLLDEPEAFLHPPQARLLGKFLAESIIGKAQLFIATHSTDFLDGLLDAESDRVRIVRLRREGDVNIAKELGKEQTRSIAKDTLTRYSRVFDGIFFEHVIICESDADCMFYQSILNLPSISGERRPDVLFVHTAGKHRMGKLAETLRALGVPVSVIADIDVLNDEATIKQLIEKLGGDWSALRSKWSSVEQTVLKQRPPVNALQIKGMIETALQDVKGTAEFPKEKKKEIDAAFKTASPWSSIKTSGRSGLPGGQPIQEFDALSNALAELGLWIVPVGEIEGFCRTVGGHGPRFVEQVLEERDLTTDRELEDAREFIKKVWEAAKA